MTGATDGAYARSQKDHSWLYPSACLAAAVVGEGTRHTVADAAGVAHVEAAGRWAHGALQTFWVSTRILG